MLSISGLNPAPGEDGILPSSTIEFVIENDGNGIDQSSLIVEVNGQKAISEGLFLPDFDGALSLISIISGNLNVEIDYVNNFLIGDTVDLKIQIKNNLSNYFNYTYSFKIVKQEPILLDTNASGLLTSPQVLYFEYEDPIHLVNNLSINLWINDFQYITSGVFNTDYCGELSSIETSVDDTTIIKLDLSEWLRNNNYTAKIYIEDTLGNGIFYTYDFEVENKDVFLPNQLFTSTGFLGWFQGIKRVTDYGIGDTLFIEWNEPVKSNYYSDVFVLIYENQDRMSLFDADPKYISNNSNKEMTLNNLETGDTLTFGCRSFETPHSVWDFNGMLTVSQDSYLIPEPTSLRTSLAENDLVINVDSTEGYPDKGYILLDNSEVVHYTSVDRINHVFNVSTDGRSVYNTKRLITSSNKSVKMFLKPTDYNTISVFGTPTYQDGYSSGRIIDLEGVVVTDYTDNDRNVFQGFDFCGWHHPLPQETLQGLNGQDCGSYLGGEFNGMRGFNIYDRMLNHEEVLLDQTGEPFILLKRIWSGETCDCANSRKVHPKMKSCQECYGTLFKGGYEQFYNLRRADKRIMVKVNEAVEDLYLGEHQSLEQSFEPNSWTLPMPAIKDRDLLVRFDYTNDIEYIYIVLSSSREKIMYGKYGRQNLSLKRLDKTNIAYTYPLDLTNFTNT